MAANSSVVGWSPWGQRACPVPGSDTNHVPWSATTMAAALPVPNSMTSVGRRFRMSQLPHVDLAALRGLAVGQQELPVRAERHPDALTGSVLGPEHLVLARRLLQRDAGRPGVAEHLDRPEPAVR